MRLPRFILTASFRLALLYSLLFIGSVVILGAVVFWSTESALRSHLDQRILAESNALQSAFASGGRAKLLETIHAKTAGVAPLDYLVLDGSGQKLAGDLPDPHGHVGWVDVIPGLAPGAEIDEAHEEMLEAATAREFVSLLADGTVLVVGDDDVGRIDEALEAIFGAFGWAIGVTVVLAIAGSALITSGFLARVDAITRTAEAIIGGDLRRRVPLRGSNDDLDRLSATLNRMLDRIGDLMESLRQVSNDIAHDLRTPLSRVRQHLEQTRMTDVSPAALNSAIDKTISDVDDILETFSALLRIAQIEAGTRRAAFRHFELGQVAQTIVEAFAPTAEEKGQKLSLRRPSDPVTIKGDRDLLAQMIANLVENAIGHCPSGTVIDVAVDLARDGNPEIVVTDSGPGIAVEEREKVLRRFYRLEQSRTSEGHGLGLSLVAAIAGLHDAQIELSDATPGLRVRVAFGKTVSQH